MAIFEKIYQFNAIGSSGNSDWLFSNPDGTTGLSSSSGSTKRAWNWDNNTTSSSNVGPLAPKSGTGYVYTEASSPTVDNDLFIMELVTGLDGTEENITLSFWYSADTNTDNTQLIVEVFNGGTWKKEYDQNIGSGDAEWVNVGLDLSKYKNNDVKIRFTINMLSGGNIWHRDVGIDNIIIAASPVESDDIISFFKGKGIGKRAKRSKVFNGAGLTSVEIDNIITELEATTLNWDKYPQGVIIAKTHNEVYIVRESD